MAESKIPNPNQIDISIPATADLNNITQTGSYFIIDSNGSVPSNTPENVRSVMWVINRNDMPVQLLINNNNNLFYRVKYTSGWQKWNKLQGAKQS